MLTDRFTAYQASLLQRDMALTQLTVIALVLVMAYVLVGKLPIRIQPWIRGVYLIGGALLYVLTMLVSVR